MFQYVMRRILIAVPMLLGAMSIVFFAMRILPGNPCMAMMGDQATTEALADCSRNRPERLPVQCVDFWRAVQFDLANPSARVIRQRVHRAHVPAYLVLVMAAIVALVGVPIGIARPSTGAGPHRLPLRIFALLGLSMPVFWLGILLPRVPFT
jgi:ABC-type dipeptide/oligopeptide/nickel transport system permease component